MKISIYLEPVTQKFGYLEQVHSANWVPEQNREDASM